MGIGSYNHSFMAIIVVPSLSWLFFQNYTSQVHIATSHMPTWPVTVLEGECHHFSKKKHFFIIMIQYMESEVQCCFFCLISNHVLIEVSAQRLFNLVFSRNLQKKKFHCHQTEQSNKRRHKLSPGGILKVNVCLSLYLQMNLLTLLDSDTPLTILAGTKQCHSSARALWLLLTWMYLGHVRWDVV